MLTYSAKSDTESVQFQYLVKTFIGVPQIGVQSDVSWSEWFLAFPRVFILGPAEDEGNAIASNAVSCSPDHTASYRSTAERILSFVLVHCNIYYHVFMSSVRG